MRLKWTLSKPWHYFIFFLFWIPMMLLGLSVFINMMKYDYEKREVVKFSQLSVCNKNGDTVNNKNGSSMFYVSSETERIYICGSVETPHELLLSIDLDEIKNGDEHEIFGKTSSKILHSGPFVFDLITTERLEPGEYRARLKIGRIEKGDVRFRIEK